MLCPPARTPGRPQTGVRDWGGMAGSLVTRISTAVAVRWPACSDAGPGRTAAGVLLPIVGEGCRLVVRGLTSDVGLHCWHGLGGHGKDAVARLPLERLPTCTRAARARALHLLNERRHRERRWKRAEHMHRVRHAAHDGPRTPQGPRLISQHGPQPGLNSRIHERYPVPRGPDDVEEDLLPSSCDHGCLAGVRAGGQSIDSATFQGVRPKGRPEIDGGLFPLVPLSRRAQGKPAG